MLDHFVTIFKHPRLHSFIKKSGLSGLLALVQGPEPALGEMALWPRSEVVQGTPCRGGICPCTPHVLASSSNTISSIQHC